METNLNDRISKIIEYSQLSSSEFADEIEVQRSSISHITSGRNKPSLDFLLKVKNRFPELEWEWLIQGEGEMLKSEEKNIETDEKPKPTSLPDLFSLIDDDQFGITESEDRISKQAVPDFPIPEPSKSQTILSDSQPLENEEKIGNTQPTENQKNKIKRVVLFFENGKFESYEL